MGSTEKHGGHLVGCWGAGSRKGGRGRYCGGTHWGVGRKIGATGRGCRGKGTVLKGSGELDVVDWPGRSAPGGGGVYVFSR